MLTQNINPLKLATALINIGKEAGTKHSLLDLVVLLAINEHPGCSEADLGEIIIGERNPKSRSSLYGPTRRLTKLGFIEKSKIDGAISKLGENKTSIKLTKNGIAFLKANQYGKKS